MERFPAPIKQTLTGQPTRKRRRSKPIKTEEPTIQVVDLTPRHRFLKWGGLALVGFLMLLLGGFYRDASARFLPKTILENTDISGLTPPQALAVLQAAPLTPPEHTLQLTANEHSIASSSAQLNARFVYEHTLDEMLRKQHTARWSWFKQLLFPADQPAHFLPIQYGAEELATMITALKQTTDVPAHAPAMTLGRSGTPATLAIDRGLDAFELNSQDTLYAITDFANTLTSDRIAHSENQTLSVSAVTTTLSQRLTDEQLQHARDRAEKIIGETLIFERNYFKKTLRDTDLIPLLTLPDGYDVDRADALLQTWAQDLNRTAQNAEFVYNPDTLEVTTFVPDRAGLMLDIPIMKQRIEEGLKELEGTDSANLTDKTLVKDLALIETPADVTLAETNDLGINERIGFGESYYAHSIPSRIHNVALTASRINFTIVKPGEEFSFNKTLGDVSSLTGFQPAYVIKDGATVLGDGGGVCQVSSTLFRALLDSGLKITRRLPHSYRVSYYELDSKPGFDATVYAGDVDLRFVNDTGHAVLLYSYTNSNDLYMFIELYGTSDGRTTEIKDYQSWDARPALPTIYVPDPTLAPGQLKQIDWSAAGIKAQFTHIIRDKDGKVMSEKTYYSNYRPWAAKFLQGI